MTFARTSAFLSYHSLGFGEKGIVETASFFLSSCWAVVYFDDFALVLFLRQHFSLKWCVFCCILLSILVEFTFMKMAFCGWKWCSVWSLEYVRLSLGSSASLTLSTFFLCRRQFIALLEHVQPRVGTNEFSVSLYYKYLLSTHKKLSIKWWWIIPD